MFCKPKILNCCAEEWQASQFYMFLLQEDSVSFTSCVNNKEDCVMYGLKRMISANEHVIGYASPLAAVGCKGLQASLPEC